MTVGAFVGYLELFLRFVDRGFRIPQLVNSIQSGAAAYARLRPLLAPAAEGRGRASSAPRFKPGTSPASRRTRGQSPGTHAGPVAVALRGRHLQLPGRRAPRAQGARPRHPAGFLVGVTGPVGSGKSALARAILGIYPIESGTVLVDDRPPATARRPTSAHGLIGYLPQDALLFSGSVRENLTLAGRASGSGRRGCCRRPSALAALEEDCRGFPSGLDTRDRRARRPHLRRPAPAPGPRARDRRRRAELAGAAGAGRSVLGRRRRDRGAHRRVAAQAFGPHAPASRPRHRSFCARTASRRSRTPIASWCCRTAGSRASGTHAELLARTALYARIFRAQLTRRDGRESERGDERERARRDIRAAPARSLAGNLASLLQPWRGASSPSSLFVLAAGRSSWCRRSSSARSSTITWSSAGQRASLLLAVLYLAASAAGQVTDVRLRLPRGDRRAGRPERPARAAVRAPSAAAGRRDFDRTPLGDAISRCTADVETLDTVFTSRRRRRWWRISCGW